MGETEVEPVDENVGQLDSDGKLVAVGLGDADGEPLDVTENVGIEEAEGEPLGLGEKVASAVTLADALALALALGVISCRFLLKPVLTSSNSDKIRIFILESESLNGSQFYRKYVICSEQMTYITVLLKILYGRRRVVVEIVLRRLRCKWPLKT